MAGNKTKILFVCTGNICRSPMAEGLFKALIRGRDDFEVRSAGVSTTHGQLPSENAVAALRAVGIEISNFRSQPITEKMIAEADYIFAMTRSHMDAIAMFFPEASEKIFLLKEFDREPGDIPDPIGQDLTTYQRCRDAIRKSLPGILQFIEQQAMTSTSSTIAALTVAIGTDHGGVELKRKLVEHLTGKQVTVRDLGSDSEQPVDYPDYAAKVCQEIIAGNAEFGILLCKSGIGMSIAANRYPQIRAALLWTPEDAALTRHHNDSNVLCLSANEVTTEEACAIVDAFLTTQFEGGRHAARVEKLSSICPAPSALAATDPEVFAAVRAEGKRQFENIELIASENFTSRAVMEAQGSCLTNKYAEGYPGKRWYGGCEHVDVVEQLAIDRAKQLFGAEHVNVQPHSGSQANMAVYFSVLQPGDRILTMNLAHGGHLTHGNKANFSGRFFEVTHYGVSERDERIDYDQLAEQAQACKPKMITAGASAYPRILDWERMRQIADSVGAMLFVDMAHIAGLVAGGVHPSPVPFADFVTTTTHKSLRGPRGGIIMCRAQYAKGIDSQTFPGCQGGPLMHVIAAKAVCLREALQPGFKTYVQQIVNNAKAMAARLSHNGYRIVSGGTDNHLMLIDLRPNGLNGKVAQETLDQAGITVNKNGIPFDTEPITKGGGIRIGTPAVTTRGMKEEEMMEIADLIHDALRQKDDAAALAKVREHVRSLTSRFPLP